MLQHCRSREVTLQFFPPLFVAIPFFGAAKTFYEEVCEEELVEVVPVLATGRDCLEQGSLRLLLVLRLVKLVCFLGRRGPVEVAYNGVLKSE